MSTPLSNAELREALYPFGNAAQIVGAKRVELYDVVRTLITSQKAIWEKEARIEEQYRWIWPPHAHNVEGTKFNLLSDRSVPMWVVREIEQRANDRIAELSTEVKKS